MTGGPAGLDPSVRAAAIAARGFMPTDEGDALFVAGQGAAAAVPGAPFLEIGSYCGKASVWLGAAGREAGTVIFSLDHHRGSEENQPGCYFFQAEDGIRDADVTGVQTCA